MNPRIKREFHVILETWKEDLKSHNDIYHLILDWMQRHSTLRHIPEVIEILDRMKKGEEIVEDFIYGERYSRFRSLFN